jgi:hypothetical protein
VSFLDRFAGGAGARDGDPIRRQAEALYASLRDEARPAGALAVSRGLPTARKILEECTVDVQGAVLHIACEEILGATERRFEDWRAYLARDVINSLLRRKITVHPDRVAAIFETCASIGSSYEHWIPVRSLLSLLSKPPTRGETDALQRLQFTMEQSTYAGPRKIAERIDEILHGDERALLPGGAWSARVLSDISAFEPEPRNAWCELLVHLLAARDSAPARKWESQLQVCLEAVGRSLFLQRALDWLALGPIPDSPPAAQVPERDADYLKGFVWALSAFGEPAVPRALADLAEQCLRKVPNHGPVSARVGNACIGVLARLGGNEPVAQLGRLRTRVKYAVGVRLIEKALTEAATRAGLTPEELEEIAVPTFDLDQSGRLQQSVGGFVAEVRVTGTDDVVLSWFTPQGAGQKSLPAAVRQAHAAELNQLKKTAKDIAAILPGQRARLERMLESERLIPLEAWRERYPQHPVVGEMSRRLIWQFSEGERTELGVFCGGRILDVNDRPMDWLSSSTGVRLWHPLGCLPELVLAWRRRLGRHAVVQPFKQAHREIYILTGAERATGVYSNRFAAHILRQHQFAALCRERGWHYALQGDWDSANTPGRRLPRWNVEIQFLVDVPADRTGLGQSGVFQYICTDQVRFCRDGAPIRIEEVPALAFSEAMRDVDLFVSVCTVGNDPAWADRGPEPYGEYWRNYSVGQLSETAQTRRTVLEALIPKLRIADRLSLEERFLVVRGDLATYRIHLASGNVLMEPGSQYLCIVPAPGEKPMHPRDVWLPFEGDTGLSVILSKALVLAADTKITDPVILQQLRRR